MVDTTERAYFDLRRGKLSHALMIDGGNESQRADTARSIAKALVCADFNGIPCGQCPHCVKASAGVHPDIAVYTGGTTPGSFKVDDVREIRRLAGILPNEAERKVFILERTQSMSAAAQNALLKILEEPPAYVCFILTCDSHDRMLDTILSRVTQYPIVDALDEINPKVEQARALACEMLYGVAERREAEVLKKTAVFEKDKDLFRLCLSQMGALCADALVSKITDTGDEAASDIGSRISREKLADIVAVCTDCLQYMNGNLNANLLLTYFCAQLNV